MQLFTMPNKAEVMSDTWGHLERAKNTRHKIAFYFSVGRNAYTLLDWDSVTHDSSPKLYYAVCSAFDAVCLRVDSDAMAVYRVDSIYVAGGKVLIGKKYLKIKKVWSV